MTELIADPVASYMKVVDELLAARARGPLDDDTEERFLDALSDWRSVMTLEQEDQLEKLVTERQLRP